MLEKQPPALDTADCVILRLSSLQSLNVCLWPTALATLLDKRSHGYQKVAVRHFAKSYRAVLAQRLCAQNARKATEYQR